MTDGTRPRRRLTIVAAVLGGVIAVPLVFGCCLYGWLFVSLAPLPWPRPNAPLPALHVAAMADDHARVLELLDAGEDVNLQVFGNRTHPNGTTPLMIAATRGHRDTVDLLLQRGADVAIANAHGDRPIHRSDSSVLPQLIDAGANIEARTGFMQTPIMRQAMKNRRGQDLDAVILLIEAGVDLTAQDFYGQTALDLVKGFPDSDPEVIRMLEAATEAMRATSEDR